MNAIIGNSLQHRLFINKIVCLYFESIATGSIKMELEEGFRHALDGQAVLFVGAGFSAQARSRRDEFLPTGPDLAKFLSGELRLPSVPSLDVVADMYKERFGEFKLINVLQEKLTATAITAHQAAFGKVPWRRIYTTNYDNVIELAYQQAHRPL